MKKVLLFIAVMCMVGVLGAEEVVIGNGTTSIRYPLNDSHTHSRSQCIYLASEIGRIGTIHKLAWKINSTGANTNAIGTTQIWLNTVSKDVFQNTNWEDPGTLVFEINNIDLSPNGDWYEIDINDYEYTGENLLVSVYTQNAAKGQNDAAWDATGLGVNRSRLGNSDTQNPPNMDLSSYRPNLKIIMTEYDPNVAPLPAILQYPLNGRWFVSGEKLMWKKGGGIPTAYDLYLDTENPPLIKVKEDHDKLFYTLEGLEPGTTYYWQVVPKNQAGIAQNCPIWSFKTPRVNNLVESFEGGFPPQGWASQSDWEQFGLFSFHRSYSAHGYVRTGSKLILSTPKLRIKEADMLSFWAMRGQGDYPLEIVYSADNNNWNTFSSVALVEENTWYNTNLDLSELAGNKYHLGFSIGPNGKNYYIDNVIGPEIFTFDFPVGETEVIPNDPGEAFNITMSGSPANLASEQIPPFNNTDFIASGSIALELLGGGPWTISIGTSAPWGAYYLDGKWHGVQNIGNQIVMQIEAVRAGLILPIVLGNVDLSLAVTLSAFSASLNARHQAVINWVSETESGMLGYYLLRNKTSEMASALIISELIPAINSSEQQVYIYTDKELSDPGTYYYWLQACDMNGSVSYYCPIFLVYDLPESENQAAPLLSGLHQLFPNPFNPQLNICYQLADADEIELSIYNTRGQLLRTLDKGSKNPGQYRLVWDAKDERGQSMGSGLYFVRLQTRKQVYTEKVLLLK